MKDAFIMPYISDMEILYGKQCFSTLDLNVETAESEKQKMVYFIPYISCQSEIILFGC